MKKILVLILLFVAVRPAFASHLLGGQITFQATDSLNYKIFVTAYRDCNGTTMGVILPLYVFHGNQDTVIYGSLKNTRDVTNLPASCAVGSKCSGGFNPYGFQEYLYEFNLNLSGIKECEISLFWGECCRVNSLTTGGAAKGFILKTTLNKCVEGGLSSMQFPFEIPFIHHYSRNKIFSMGGVDTIGTLDSVAYELTTPLIGMDTLMQYNSGYSYDKPLTYLGSSSYPYGFNFSPLTGCIGYKPYSNNQVSTFSVLVKQYIRREDTMMLVSTIHKNYTAFVLNQGQADAEAETYYGFSNDINRIYAVCAGDTLLLKDLYHNVSGSSLYFYSSVGDIPFVDTSYIQGNKVYQVTYFPPYSTGNKPKLHYAIHYAKDNSCSLGNVQWGSISRVFRVYSKIDSTTHPIISKRAFCNGLSLKMTDTSNLALSEIVWNLNGMEKQGDSVNFLLADSGWYHFSLHLNNPGNCGYTYYDSVYVHNTNKSRPSFQYVIDENCDYDTAYMTVVDSQRISIWYLNEIDSANILHLGMDTLQGVQAQYLSILKDTANCFFVDTLNFRNKNVPRLNQIGSVNQCTGNLIDLKISTIIDSSYGIQPLTFFVNGVVTNSLDTSFYPTNSDKLSRYIVDSIGCSYTDTIQINITTPYTLYAGKDTAVCIGGPVKSHVVSNISTGYFNRMDWLGIGQGINLNFPADSSRYIVLETESYDHCVQRDSFYLIVDEYMNAHISGDSVLCPGEVKAYSFAANGYGPYSSTWYHDSTIQSGSGDTIQFVGSTKTDTLSIRVVDNQGCVSMDTMMLHHRLPIAYVNDSIFVCNNAEFTVKIDSFTDLTPVVYNWQVLHGTMFSVSDSFNYFPSQVSGIDSLALFIRDNYGCQFRDTITLFTSPLSSRIDAHPLVCGGDSLLVKAQVTGASYPLLFDWKVGSLNAADSNFYFVPVPGNSYWMRLTVTDDNACQSSDSFQFVTTNFTLDIQGDSQLCVQESKSWLPNPRLAAYPVTYLWNVNQNPSNDSILSLSNKDWLKGDLILSLKGVDHNGCVARDTLQVYNSKFSHVPFKEIRLCFMDSIHLTTNDTASLGSVNYLWESGFSSDNHSSLNLLGDIPGSQQWFLTAKDASGCEIRDSVWILTRKLESRILGNKTACDSNQLHLEAQVFNGYPSYTILWMRNGDTVSNTYQLNLFDTLDGSSSLLLQVTDSMNCEAWVRDSINFYSTPTIRSNLADAYCNTQQTMALDTMVAPSGGVFSTATNNLIQYFDPSSLSTGNYSLYFRVGGKGCEAMDTFIIGVLPQPSIDFYADTNVGYANFNAHFYALVIAQNPSLKWSFGDSTVAFDSLHVTHLYQDTGWFNVGLLVQDSLCTNLEYKSNFIHVFDSLANVLIRPGEWNVQVFPNPFKEQLNLHTSLQVNQIEMYDLRGKRVFHQTYNEVNEVELGLGSLASGEYIMRIFTTNGMLYARVQKTNPAR
ncbi:MAG: T9SS type A sorting domain-containing protein [Bacteroidetes bacterium]|nr:T9SS type A sorting domain-containing protein [Bacteroidota bacterium]